MIPHDELVAGLARWKRADRIGEDVEAAAADPRRTGDFPILEAEADPTAPVQIARKPPPPPPRVRRS